MEISKNDCLFLKKICLENDAFSALKI